MKWKWNEIYRLEAFWKAKSYSYYTLTTSTLYSSYTISCWFARSTAWCKTSRGLRVTWLRGRVSNVTREKTRCAKYNVPFYVVRYIGQTGSSRLVKPYALVVLGTRVLHLVETSMYRWRGTLWRALEAQ